MTTDPLLSIQGFDGTAEPILRRAGYRAAIRMDSQKSFLCIDPQMFQCRYGRRRPAGIMGLLNADTGVIDNRLKLLMMSIQNDGQDERTDAIINPRDGHEDGDQNLQPQLRNPRDQISEQDRDDHGQENDTRCVR